jgi:demethylmenaquinone methyltransferase/2-methoxy-6-polyprenyl-1,4-benzoquinol methylase
MAVDDSKDTTHFGYRQIPVGDKTRRVGEVFRSVANKYDVMNDLMSLGLHRLWKTHAINLAQVRPGMHCLDLAAGTGDLSSKLARRVGPEGRVVVSDINEAMLNRGRDRLIDEGLIGNLEFVLANAERLPFPANHFDRVTIGFGLRNVTDKDQALREMYRVLKPGGLLLVLEFSDLYVKPLKPLYDLYSFQVLPRLGQMIAGDADSYRYLAESIRVHPDQATLRDMMSGAGFEDCEYFNLNGGLVAIHRGRKY